MKKIIALVLLAGFAQAGTLTNTTAEIQERLDRPSVELSISHTNTQAFAGGSFEAINVFADNYVDSSYFTTTSSNITVLADGQYDLCLTISFKTDTASQVECHVFDNGSPITDAAGGIVGFARTQGAAASDGVAATQRLVTLSSNDVLSVKMNFTAAETVTYDACSWRLEKR